MAAIDDLETILRLIERIEQTVERETAESFRTSDDAIDAVAYRLAMIGEHCKRLPPEMRGRWPQLPWPAMVGLRNIVGHSYDTVSPAIVWRTACQELSPIKNMVRIEHDRLAGGAA